MPNWFIYDKNGVRRGPVSSAQLKALASSGKINRETIIENEAGQKAKAGQLKSLLSMTSSQSTTYTTGGTFCTGCGIPISPQAVACTKCGVDPRGHKNYCRNCGTKLNPNQVVCVKCGIQITNTPQDDDRGETSSTASDVFCTNCGSPVSINAFACTKCGAEPTSHRNFCRNCGAKLNPNQVVCVKCGSAVEAIPKRSSSGTGFIDALNNLTKPQSANRSSVKSGSTNKNKIVAGILAILLGGIGIHKFYMGSWGWGVVYVIAGLLTWGILTGIASLVEGILLLIMSDEKFAEKYPDETIAPFRW